ncbi:hypothetical protein [Streptomyces virginiae]|uniref:Uncharacterized protein n=1 Tax=Streptomyces virginiae TaxID=1961 RepID=A0ABZ1TFR7_STRVG|nr:hypothetical protein [Streptomyces virginiae]
MTQKEDRKMIAALLREREGYVRRGEDDRVRQVDEQLTFHGYEAEPDEAPVDRSSTPKETADGDGATAEERRGRGRPRKPRDAEGNIVRE